MLRIASASNPRIAAAARALRRGESVPIEGARLLGEALDAGVAPEVLFHVAGSVPEELLSRASSRGAAIVEVTEAVLGRLSDLASTRGSLALAPLPAPRVAALSRSGLGLLLDGVQDPANVGAIVRSAEAFGAEGVVTTAGSASPFTSRALRVSAGSAFRVPIAVGLPPRQALQWARDSGALLVGAEAHGGEAPAVLAGARPLVLVIGSEGHGISREVEAELARRVTIRLAGRAESLNAGAAAAVVLYALAASPSPKTSAAKR